MPSVQKYLCSIKNQNDNCKFVVIGNEAADLDSMVSTIAYGYLISKQNANGPALPVISIPRSDFILRRDAVYLFEVAGIRVEDVVFIDEVDLDRILLSSQLILVDHNRIAENLKKYTDKVVGIIDHHRDERLYTSAEPRIIETIGSTATLVAKQFGRYGLDIGKELAILFTGTILLDTVNLDPAAHKATPDDIKIVSEMLPLCPMSREDLFEKLQFERFNVHGFTTMDLLRKDYKEYHFGKLKCGIATVFQENSKWDEIDTCRATVFQEFVDYHKLDLLLVMLVSTSHHFKRELIVFWDSSSGQTRLFSYLQGNGLELTLPNSSNKRMINKGVMRIYGQGNVKISRKILQPLLAEFFI